MDMFCLQETQSSYSHHAEFEATTEGGSQSVLRKVDRLFDGMDPSVSKLFSVAGEAKKTKDIAEKLLPLCLELSGPASLGKALDTAVVNNLSQLDEASKKAFSSMQEDFMGRERKLKNAMMLFEGRISPDIWTCCSRLCFASVAVNPELDALMGELLLIYRHAERCHIEMENLKARVDKRRKGVGTSHILFCTRGREERERDVGGRVLTRRREDLRTFARFVTEVLPFLYAETDAPSGTMRPSQKLCTQAICCLLGISRNFLYHRKPLEMHQEATEEELASIVDSAGVRKRQHRRLGVRLNCPPVEDLPKFQCGCSDPCWQDVPIWTLLSEYEEFRGLSAQLGARHKENCFLLNRMYVSMTNSTTHICNTAIAALFNVSECLVGSIRAALNALGSFDQSDIGEGEESTDGREVRHERKQDLLSDGMLRYKYDSGHPLNRYPDFVRDRIERQLDVLLRADPSGSSGSSVCRVYDPNINTNQKLRETVKETLDLEDSWDTHLSESTLQRIFDAYLSKRNYNRISFTQSDHNACPNCKSMRNAILQYDHERASANRNLEAFRSSPRPFPRLEQTRVDSLQSIVTVKEFQAMETTRVLRHHIDRDRRIRKLLKDLMDHFVEVEDGRTVANGINGLGVRRRSTGDNMLEMQSWGWRSDLRRVLMTHQDDMTKVDLPHFLVDASADITRWRFDVNAHVNVVTGDTTVFSHEQGMGAKNSSAIVEEILLHHLLQCQGESIKIVVSDNASVGKNWLTTIALPQYIVDQGLADIVIIVFLENNHGKWYADMLFGQFQTRRKRCTVIGIDDMLAQFESIRKRNGKVEGFALNPLGSVDFVNVFSSLGYETTPPKDFGFVKRDIHFAGACAPEKKKELHPVLQSLLCPLLPDDHGMVRLSSQPPSDRAQIELRYEDRFMDVPAAKVDLARIRSYGTPTDTTHVDTGHFHTGTTEGDDCPPLVIPLDKEFVPNGPGVVSHRTANKLGYNGIEFSRKAACSELRNTESALIRRAYPKGVILPRFDENAHSESFRCAPVNWLVRRPVHAFCRSERDWIARYPPQNMLNAKFKMGPRESGNWCPTATYPEPPFPIMDKRSATNAMKSLEHNHTSLGETLNVLDVLREVYHEMGDRESVTEPWLQRRATIPSCSVLMRYKKEIGLWRARETGHPSAPKGVRQLFKEDASVKGKAESVLAEKRFQGTSTQWKKELDKVISRLFGEAEFTPGGLDRYRHLAEIDQERYATEMEGFKKSQRVFDEENGLLQVT